MFAEGLLHAKPCSEQRGDLEETAVLWHSQADRPDEGATDAEPGGVISSSFQEDLSFLKHMCEDFIWVFKSPGSGAESGVNWICRLREEVIKIILPNSLLCSFSHLTLKCVCSVTQSWVFCDLVGCSLPGSSVHEILQAIILEWKKKKY